MYFATSIQASIPSQVKILDLGCGNGCSLWPLLGRGFDCYGIDISDSAIKNTKAFLKQVATRETNLAVADMKSLPFDNDFFDIVLDICSMQHNPYSDLPAIVKEIARVMKPKGNLFTVYRSRDSWIEPNSESLYPLSRDELVSLITPYFHPARYETETFTAANNQVQIIHHDLLVEKI